MTFFSLFHVFLITWKIIPLYSGISLVSENTSKVLLFLLNCTFFNKALYLSFMSYIAICKPFFPITPIVLICNMAFPTCFMPFSSKELTFSIYFYLPTLYTFNHVLLFSFKIMGFYSLFHMLLLTWKKMP